MSGLVSNKFRILSAEQFYEQFSEADPSIIYAFIGRTRPWDDDNNPPTPSDNLGDIEYDIWRNIMSFKRITPSDVTFCIRNIPWESGTVFDEYSSTSATLYEDDFYVVTDDYQVYKCLSNNQGAQSIIKPTGTSTSRFITSDGYVWKFMYKISASQAIKFFTTNYMPVQTLETDGGEDQWDVQVAAVNGAIEQIDVTSPGSAYVQISGTAQAGATATITLAASASSLDGFYTKSSVYITSGTGAGQIRKIINYVGSTRIATVSSNWTTPPDATSNYIVSPTVDVNGDGVGFSAYCTIDSGALDEIRILNAGNNYSYASASVTANAGSSGTLSPMLSPNGGHGSDAIEELGGRNIMVSIRLSGSESNTITVNNDFRILGLIADPKYAADNSAANATNYSQMTVLNLTSISGTFTKDEVISGDTSNASGYMIELTSESDLRLSYVKGTFEVAETIRGESSNATATISTVTAGSLKPYTGEILYCENRGPISRNISQLEDLKLIIRF